MSTRSRTWIFIGLIGSLVIGVALIVVSLLMPNVSLPGLTPIPTALIIEQSNRPYPEVARIKVTDAHSAYAQQQALFVDVRSASQYGRSHIPGAKSIPLNELESRLTELNKSQLIITYCT